MISTLIERLDPKGLEAAVKAIEGRYLDWDRDVEPTDAEIAEAAIRAYLDATDNGWMPIETAPLDGRMLQLWNKAHDEQAIAGWTDADSLGEDEGAWTNAGNKNQGIHWMVNPNYFQFWRPLPSPPKPEPQK